MRSFRARRCLLATLAVMLLLTPAANAETLFRDDFTGPAGTAPAAPWKSMGREQCTGLAPYTRNVCDPRRATLDGRGHLQLRVTQSGAAFIGTFNYGTGWPPRGVTFSFNAPTRVTIRMRMPSLPGVWAGMWPQQVDRPSSLVDEIDMSEERSAIPDQIACYQHTHANAFTSWGYLPGRVSEWHTYSVRLEPGALTTYSVDGRQCLLAPPVEGRFGLLLHAVVGAERTWQSNFGPTVPAGRSAVVRVDYVKVSR